MIKKSIFAVDLELMRGFFEKQLIETLKEEGGIEKIAHTEMELCISLTLLAGAFATAIGIEDEDLLFEWVRAQDSIGGDMVKNMVIEKLNTSSMIMHQYKRDVTTNN